MTAMPRRFEINVTTTTADVARAGNHTVRVYGALRCPHCSQRLHATAMRDIGEDEYALSCLHCHHDVLTVTNG